MLPPLETIPEPWRSIHQEVAEEMGQEWMDRYGEESLRAAATLLGYFIPEADGPSNA